MKTTLKVSISGFAFNINDDAHRVLKAYFDKLAIHFDKREDGKEIMEDIEARVAELLMGDMQSQDQLVTLQQVERVIATVGKPEELTDKKDEKVENQQQRAAAGGSNSSDGGFRRRRFYRDPDNRKIAGVCGGIAAYFNIDPVVLRILAVALVLGGSITPFISGGGIIVITYIILWVAIPKAQTIAQKLEMRGESPTAANIERRVREEPYQRSGGGLGSVVKFFLIAIAALILLPVAIAILAAIFAIVVSLFAGGWVINTSLFSLANYVEISSLNLTLLKALTIAIIAIPLLLVLYGVLRLIFRFKTKIRGLVGIGITAWVLCIVAISFVAINTLVDYRRVTTETRTEQVSVLANNLRIELPKNFENANEELTITTGIGPNTHVSIPYLWQDEESKTLLILPDVKVTYDDSATDIGIKQVIRSRGKSRSEAAARAKQLPRYYQLVDSTLVITPIAYTKENRWKGERVRIVVTVPRTMSVSVDPNLDLNSDEWSWRFNKGHKSWKLDLDNDFWDE